MKSNTKKVSLKTDQKHSHKTYPNNRTQSCDHRFEVENVLIKDEKPNKLQIQKNFKFKQLANLNRKPFSLEVSVSH